MDAIARSRRRLRCAALLLLLALRAPSPASAQARADVEGTVLALDSGELIVDLGLTRGASEGDEIEIWRPLLLRHPITGKPLQDRFRIGTLRLTQVRPVLSLATTEGTPLREPVRGDIVVLRRSSAARAAPSAAGSATPAGSAAPAGSAPSAPPVAAERDPETAAIMQALEELRGAPPEARAERYERLARAWPAGRAARTLTEEAALLRAPGGGSAPAAPRRPIEAFGFTEPGPVKAGGPLHLALEIVGTVSGVVVHLRRPDEATYTSLPLRRAGAGYYRVQVPAEVLKAPALDYFLEAVLPDGSAVPIVGSASDARHITVLDPTQAVDPMSRGNTTASLWADYANYNLGKSNDYVVQTEGYFGLRLGDVGVRALRSGFGVFRGVGGTLHELDTLGLSGRKVGLTYGYLESELAPSESLGFILRGVLGLRADGVGGGGQLFVRIGNDRRTNLLLGGEFLGGVGLRGITQLDWRTIPRVPIVLRTEVTNQPAGTPASAPALTPGQTPTEASGQGEVGLRAIVQVGYEITPELTLAGRVSYQGRTINHAGPGLGAAVTYQW